MLDKELFRGNATEGGVSFTVTDSHEPLAFGVPGFKQRRAAAAAKNGSLEVSVECNQRSCK